jgi:hypothetical protein
VKVTGILSVSNGTGLRYPFPVVATNLSKLCDNVIVGVDPTFSQDRQTLESLGLDNLCVVDATWDRNNKVGGTEIALQMDNLVSTAQEQGSDWVVVMQADEVVHDGDFKMLRMFLERNLGTEVNGFSTERIYFWKDLNTVRKDWNARLVRIFRPGTYSFLAEGTSKDGMYSAPILPGEEVTLPYKIYHYSRVDDPKIISTRVRNLDGFFHKEESLIPHDEVQVYDFKTREYDNYSLVESPREVVGDLVSFKGTHPLGILEWYTE